MNLNGSPFTPGGDLRYSPWLIEGVGLSDFNGHERGPHSRGFTGDLEGIDCREEEQASENNSAVSVIRGRLLANKHD